MKFEIAEGAIRNARTVLSHRMEIENEEGRVLETVWFRDVVEIEC